MEQDKLKVLTQVQKECFLRIIEILLWDIYCNAERLKAELKDDNQRVNADQQQVVQSNKSKSSFFTFTGNKSKNLDGNKAQFNEKLDEFQLYMQSYRNWSESLLMGISAVVDIQRSAPLTLNDLDLEDQVLDEGTLTNGLFSIDSSLIGELLFMASIQNGAVYDARSQCLFHQVMQLANVTSLDTITLELNLSRQVQLQVYAQQLASQSDNHDKIIGEHSTRNKNKRMWTIGAGVAAGGLLVGITGGLAAPLVAGALIGLGGSIGIGAGTLAFLGGTSGLALIGSVFGVTGASIAGMKMEYKSRGIQEFKFIDVDTSIPEDMLQQSGGWFSKKKQQQTLQSPLPSSEELQEDPLSATKSPFVTIAISGWMTQLTDALGVWQCLLARTQADQQNQCLNGECLSLVFESKELMAMGNAVEELIKTEAVGYLTRQVLMRTILANVMLAVAWPLSLLKIASLVDNPWSIVMDRSFKAGQILGDILFERLHGHRPIKLIGTSAGARVIYFALLQLYERAVSSQDVDAFGIVSDVVLIGAPIAASQEEWRRVQMMVANKIYNAYSNKDWILGFLFRATSFGSIAGLKDVDTKPSRGNNLVNVDCSDIIDGHNNYKDSLKIKSILERCNVITC
ncbi:hypothetical protein MP228_005040 [Amoeboaphelidium protococcarum]|nr:hypothetical protein MP228_005040 [Amoeboaphelidium protococcarum]